MQIWTTYHEGEIDKALLFLSQQKIKLGLVIKTTNGETITATQYDAAASHGKGGMIHAFLRIGEIIREDDEIFYDLEHTQLYPRDISEMIICDKWVSETESPESVLKPGMNVHVKRMDTGEVFEGELTAVTFLDIVIKTDNGEVSVPASKIRSMIIL